MFTSTPVESLFSPPLCERIREILKTVNSPNAFGGVLALCGADWFKELPLFDQTCWLEGGK